MQPPFIAFILCAFGTVQAYASEKEYTSTRWEKTIQNFVAADEKSPPPKQANLFVGSSSIRLWKLDESFPGFATINRGFGGSQMADSTHYVEDLVLKHRPRVVVVYAGDNDLAAGKSPETILKDYRKFVERVHAELPETNIVYLAVKASTSRWKLADKIRETNAKIAKFSDSDERLVFINVFEPMLGEDGLPRKELLRDDGLHLTDAGYELWSKLVRPHLLKNPHLSEK